MKQADKNLKLNAILLYIINNFKEGIEIKNIFRILYFSEQEHIITYGTDFTYEDFYISDLELGIIPSNTAFIFWTLLNGETYSFNMDFALKKIDYNNQNSSIIEANTLPCLDELSKSNISVINTIIKKYNDGKLDSYGKIPTYLKNCDHKLSIIDIAKIGSASKSFIEYLKLQEHFRKKYCN